MNDKATRIRDIVKNCSGGLVQQLLRIPPRGKLIRIRVGDKTFVLKASAEPRSQCQPASVQQITAQVKP
jgi:hypothetical protein